MRPHGVTCLLDDCLWISWIDREGAIVSSGFSFFENLPLLLVLLLVLQRFGRTQWGYISELDGKSQSIMLHPIEADGGLGTGEVAVKFDPTDKVHSVWSLLGRATTVVGASRNEQSDRKIAEGSHTLEPFHGGVDHAGVPQEINKEDTTKIRLTTVTTGTDNERANRWRKFYQARDDYREHYADAIRSRNLVLKVSWPEKSRVAEWKIIKQAQTLGKNDKFIEGHIPEVKCARDFGRYSTDHIRRFLDLEQDGTSGSRTLRLIVMKRLWPIYDLDGEQFWDAFWQCVMCMCSLPCLRKTTDTTTAGHYRLWVNGIRHGDISLTNLLYDLCTGKPVGILNDFDLATWVDHSTTNHDRTGTIPFMAIDLLKDGLDRRTPRLYRHDIESFSWVLAFVTVAHIEYKDRTIKISSRKGVHTWFQDRDQDQREAHILSKTFFHSKYGKAQGVTAPYSDYINTIRQITRYWSNFHEAREPVELILGPEGEPIEDEPVDREPETDDPLGSLRSLVTAVEKALGEAGAKEGFLKVKAYLIEAIETPAVATVDTVSRFSCVCALAFFILNSIPVQRPIVRDPRLVPMPNADMKPCEGYTRCP